MQIPYQQPTQKLNRRRCQPPRRRWWLKPDSFAHLQHPSLESRPSHPSDTSVLWWIMGLSSMPQQNQQRMWKDGTAMAIVRCFVTDLAVPPRPPQPLPQHPLPTNLATPPPPPTLLAPCNLHPPSICLWTTVCNLQQLLRTAHRCRNKRQRSSNQCSPHRTLEKPLPSCPITANLTMITMPTPAPGTPWILRTCPEKFLLGIFLSLQPTPLDNDADREQHQIFPPPSEATISSKNFEIF